jgi:hypothetical protein
MCLYHFPPFLTFFWAFWAALSWTLLCWVLSLLMTFFSPLFLSSWFFFLYLIYKIAYWANAFLSYGLAVLSFLIASRVTPSMALSLLKTLFFFFFPASSCLVFLLSLLQAVVHLIFCAFIFLRLILRLLQT